MPENSSEPKRGLEDAVAKEMTGQEQRDRVAKILQLSFGSRMWRADRDQIMAGVKNVVEEIKGHLYAGGAGYAFLPQPSIVTQVDEIIDKGYASGVQHWGRTFGARVRKQYPVDFDVALSKVLEAGEHYARENLSSD